MAIITTVNPLIALLILVLGVESGFTAIGSVELFLNGSHLSMGFILQEMPFQVDQHIPFAPLGKFHTHKESLFAWMGKHVGVQTAHIG